MATTLTAPNGAKVTVADDKVAQLLSRGFTTAQREKTPTKKSTSSKSSK